MNYTKGEVGILVKEDVFGYLFFMLLNCTIKGRTIHTWPKDLWKC